MKKIIKRTVAFLTTIVMMLFATVTTFATENCSSLGVYLNETLSENLKKKNSSRSAFNVEDEIREYVNQTLPYYLSNRQYFGTYNISDIIPINNWDGNFENKYLVVVSNENIMIGTLTVEFIGDTIISAFREEFIPELNLSLKNGTAFQLGYSEGCFMIYTNDGVTVIENPDCVNTDFVNAISIDLSSDDCFTLNDSITSAPTPRVTTYQTSPGCSIVSNATSQDTGKGLCWAACVASMVMQAGNGTGLSALKIYNDCKNSTESGKPDDTYPSGIFSWISFAFSLYDMSVTNDGSALSTTEVIDLLSDNKPIYARFKRTLSDGSESKHSMVLWYCTYIDTRTAQYVFMDPGSSTNSSMVSVIINSSLMADGTDLSITSRNGNTYTEWYGAIY